MKNLKEVEEAKPEYDPSKAIIVESEEDNSYLTDLGLNQYYPIITASDSPLLKEELLNYDLVFYVYSQGILDFEGMPNLIMINIDENDYEIIPEKIINFFIQNKELFSKVYEIQKIRNNESVLGEIIDQSPIGRTPRSNLATYTKVFDHMRDIFSQIPEAKLRG